jgi:hypothetical protein
VRSQVGIGLVPSTVYVANIHSKHLRRIHDRPHKCVTIGCKSEGYSSQSELKRHIDAKHTVQNLYCTIPGCSQKKRFNRKDNLNEHIRRKHPEFEKPTTASPSRSSSPQQRASEGPLSPNSSVPFSSGSKRKDRASTDAEEHSQSTKKRKDLQEEIQTLKAENLQLRYSRDRELDKLRARVKWLEDNNKLLTQVVDRMSRDKA